MSSGDHLWSQQFNHQQLQMFMPAGELRENIPNDFIPGDPWGSKSVEELWTNKLEASKHRTSPTMRHVSLYDRIASEGVIRPVRVHVGDGTILDGHHRIAAASDIDPKMEVPVENVGSRRDRDLKTTPLTVLGLDQ